VVGILRLGLADDGCEVARPSSALSIEVIRLR
jgi:hypothetical protein